MRNRLVAGAVATLGLVAALAAAGPGQAARAAAGPVLVPQAFQAPDVPGEAARRGMPAPLRPRTRQGW